MFKIRRCLVPGKSEPVETCSLELFLAFDFGIDSHTDWIRDFSLFNLRYEVVYFSINITSKRKKSGGVKFTDRGGHVIDSFRSTHCNGNRLSNRLCVCVCVWFCWSQSSALVRGLSEAGLILWQTQDRAGAGFDMKTKEKRYWGRYTQGDGLRNFIMREPV